MNFAMYLLRLLIGGGFWVTDTTYRVLAFLARFMYEREVMIPALLRMLVYPRNKHVVSSPISRTG